MSQSRLGRTTRPVELGGQKESQNVPFRSSLTATTRDQDNTAHVGTGTCSSHLRTQVIRHRRIAEFGVNGELHVVFEKPGGGFAMQAEQVIWLIVGVIAVCALLFLIRLFRIPQDDRLAFPSTAAEQEPTQSADVPRIRSKEDLIAFFQQETGDQKLALLMADAYETMGWCIYIDVRQGGSGNPYEVEYDHRIKEEQAADRRSAKEIRAEIDRLAKALKSATSDDERDRLERQIARLAGGVAIFWINVTSSADYERQRRLIKESFRKLRELSRSDRPAR